eukprot:4129221-Pyramimonas_sp.AAC.1
MGTPLSEHGATTDFSGRQSCQSGGAEDTEQGPTEGTTGTRRPRGQAERRKARGGRRRERALTSKQILSASAVHTLGDS